MALLILLFFLQFLSQTLAGEAYPDQDCSNCLYVNATLQSDCPKEKEFLLVKNEEILLTIHKGKFISHAWFNSTGSPINATIELSPDKHSFTVDFGKPVTEDFKGKWKYTILTNCPSYYMKSCYLYENKYYLEQKCSTKFKVMNPPVATINNDVIDFYSTRRSGISRPLTLDLYYAYKYRPGKQNITFKYNKGQKGKFIVEGPKGKRGETESKESYNLYIMRADNNTQITYVTESDELHINAVVTFIVEPITDILAMYIDNDKVEFEPENDESVIQYVHRYKKNDAPSITCQSLSHHKGKILINNTLLREVSSWVPGIKTVRFDSRLMPSNHEKHLDCIYKDENKDYTVTARIIFHIDDDNHHNRKIRGRKLKSTFNDLTEGGKGIFNDIINAIRDYVVPKAKKKRKTDTPKPEKIKDNKPVVKNTPKPVKSLDNPVVSNTPKPEKIEDDKSVVKIWINGEIKTSNYKLLYEMSEVVNITCAYKYKKNPTQFYPEEVNLYFYEKVSNNRRSEIQLQGYTSGKNGDEYYIRSLNTLNEKYDGKTIYCGFNEQGKTFHMAQSVEVTMEMTVTTEAHTTATTESVTMVTPENQNEIYETQTTGQPIWHWLLLVAGVCLILVLITGIVKLLIRNKTWHERVNHYENFDNGTVPIFPNSPTLENAYNTPSDNKNDEPTYAQPYVPKNPADLYSTPIPKGQRKKEKPQECLYAGLSFHEDQNSGYAEINTNQSKGEEENPYATIKEIDEQLYSKVVPENKDYVNVFDNQSYVNSMNKAEYVEPSYCEVKPKIKKKPIIKK